MGVQTRFLLKSHLPNSYRGTTKLHSNWGWELEEEKGELWPVIALAHKPPARGTTRPVTAGVSFPQDWTNVADLLSINMASCCFTPTFWSLPQILTWLIQVQNPIGKAVWGKNFHLAKATQCKIIVGREGRGKQGVASQLVSQLWMGERGGLWVFPQQGPRLSWGSGRKKRWMSCWQRRRRS